jgi:6-pyruvoyltetrahydropterin/6-carboxytetrahydropterin synthase
LQRSISDFRNSNPEPSCGGQHLTKEEKIGMILLTRRATFSASHYYWNPNWTEERNLAVFGRCANRNGHGHNYTLEVTVTGAVDPVSGFVVDLKWLKDVIEREVLEVYDHRHLNLEVAEFLEVIPTTENMAIAIWKRLEGPVTAAGGARLNRIRVYETDDIFAEFRGEA